MEHFFEEKAPSRKCMLTKKSMFIIFIFVTQFSFESIRLINCSSHLFKIWDSEIFSIECQTFSLSIQWFHEKFRYFHENSIFHFLIYDETWGKGLREQFLQGYVPLQHKLNDETLLMSWQNEWPFFCKFKFNFITSRKI